MSNITVKSGDTVVISSKQTGYNKTTVAQQPAQNQIDIAGLKGGGDKNYVHTQDVPSAIWTVTHNLGKRPAAVVVDSSESVVYGDIQYVDDNILTLTFSGAFSGKAYFN
jgi:hypothetical protein